MRPTMRMIAALSAFAIALTAQPGEFESLRSRGFELERANKYAEAIELFQKAATLNPNDAGIHQFLGSAYRHLYTPGDQRRENVAMANRAEAEFHRSFDLKPSSSSTLDGLISLKYDQRKFADAAEWASRLFTAMPGNKLGHYWMGALLVADLESLFKTVPAADRGELTRPYSARIDDAIVHLRRAVALDPTYEAAMTSLARLLEIRTYLRSTAELAQSDIDQSVRWQQRAAEAHTTNAAMKFQRIRVGGDVQVANLLRKPLPSCPSGVHITDQVHLTVVIAKDGEVQDIDVIGGDPSLVPTVVEAVGRWVYKPTTLNNIPVEVITRVDVNMNCGR